MESLKTKKPKTKLIDTENTLVVARDRGFRVGKMDEGGQKVQTSNYKIKSHVDI